MNFIEGKKIMGSNFIGPEELREISSQLHITKPNKEKVPIVPFSRELLENFQADYLLILGVDQDQNGNKLTVKRLRDIFGLDPEKFEPCFYNQDWYLREPFATEITLRPTWYLIRTSVIPESRGQDPKKIIAQSEKQEIFPSAVLTAFSFFSYYLLTKKMLWQHDFIWCSDKDENGDRIYTGRYLDPNKINKNGFNIHRHLSIRPCYGLAPQIL